MLNCDQIYEVFDILIFFARVELQADIIGSIHGHGLEAVFWFATVEL